jgi:hypothetical protein
MLPDGNLVPPQQYDCSQKMWIFCFRLSSRWTLTVLPGKDQSGQAMLDLGYIFVEHISCDVVELRCRWPTRNLDYKAAKHEASSKQGSTLDSWEAITVKQKWPHLDIVVSDVAMPTNVRSSRIVLNRVFSKADRFKDCVSSGTEKLLPLFILILHVINSQRCASPPPMSR